MRKSNFERCLEIALYFELADPRVTVPEIGARFYPHLSNMNTVSTTFGRDRELLAEHGYFFEYDGSNRLWSLKKGGKTLRFPNLSDADSAALSLALGAMLYEPSFPLRFDLGMALSKLSSKRLRGHIEVESDLMLESKMTLDADAERQAEICNACITALSEKRRIGFRYVKESGMSSSRSGLVRCVHFYFGQWYILLSELDNLNHFQTFAISNMFDLELFEEHEELELEPIGKEHAFPFLWGTSELKSVELIIPAHLAPQKELISLGYGEFRESRAEELNGQESGSLIWRVNYRDEDRLFRYILERNFGISNTSKDEQRALLAYLESVVSVNG